MMSLRTTTLAAVAASMLTAPIAVAQTTDPMTGPLVAGAPFSADAITTVTQTLGDGTRIEQKVTAKFYRDSTGRVRREQTIIGLDALDPSAQPRTMITFDSVPGDPSPYTVDPVARTVRRMPRGQFQYFAGPNWNTGVAIAYTPNPPRKAELTQISPDMRRELERAVNQLSLNLNKTPQGRGLAPAAPIPPDVRSTEEQLGTRQIEGVKATGRRTTAVIPIDRVGNDRPITITDERWESPELRLLVYSRFSDPRTGVVEYKLTGITRSEPRADLFTVPADFTLIPSSVGIRTGGPAPAAGGGRGQRGAAPPQ
jgi:hypothetical protein